MGQPDNYENLKTAMRIPKNSLPLSFLGARTVNIHSKIPISVSHYAVL